MVVVGLSFSSYRFIHGTLSSFGFILMPCRPGIFSLAILGKPLKENFYH